VPTSQASAHAIAPHIPALYYLALGLFVVGRFLMRELRERKMTLSRIFLVPGIVGLLALFLIVTTVGLYPQTAVLIAGETLVTLGVGLAVGLAVAHFTKVRPGDTPGTVYVLGSGTTVAIWIGALALRLLVRLALPPSDVVSTQSANVALIVMVAAALGMVRYRILTEAKILQRPA
jgi:hypothetical protein